MAEKAFITTAFQELKNVVLADGVICYPTEAVWGLGCHPHSETAFEKVLQLKQRPSEKGVILLVADYQQLQYYAKLTEPLYQQLQTIWPGFVTCLLPKSEGCPDYLTGEHNTVAVRMTNYPPLRDLCLSVNSAIVSTSANISGCPPVQTLDEAVELFGKQVDGYWDSDLEGHDKPSRIIQLTDNKQRIIRD